MPLSSEHLATAEELAVQARERLHEGAFQEAEAFGALASVYVQLAQARQQIIGSSAPPAERAVELPEWCGQCDGPDLNMRWVDDEGADGRRVTRRCPTCNPYAERGISDPVPPARPGDGTLENVAN